MTIVCFPIVAPLFVKYWYTNHQDGIAPLPGDRLLAFSEEHMMTNSLATLEGYWWSLTHRGAQLVPLDLRGHSFSTRIDQSHAWTFHGKRRGRMRTLVIPLFSETILPRAMVLRYHHWMRRRIVLCRFCEMVSGSSIQPLFTRKVTSSKEDLYFSLWVSSGSRQSIHVHDANGRMMFWLLVCDQAGLVRLPRISRVRCGWRLRIGPFWRWQPLGYNPRLVQTQ